MGDIWGLVASNFASILLMWTMIQKYFPNTLTERLSEKLTNLFYPYIEVRFFEHSGDYMKRSEAFSAIEHYLTCKSSEQARKLKGDFVRQSLVLKMDEKEEVSDEFEGIKFVWSLRKTVPNTKSMSFYPASDKRYYLLKFHDRYRCIVTGSYLNHVLVEGKAIGLSKRQRKLYTNGSGDGDHEKRSKWSHVIFEHPASFETLAMDPNKKKEIVDDLTTFSKAKEYYARIGKPWKRGYLLYGPPGTGKSTLISAIANFLGYDIYDIELTAVQTNAELRKLLIGITSKSVVVIEDIDCSLDLTGQRKTNSESGEGEEEKNPVTSMLKQVEASSGERLIIFTTNYVEKLDQALIRRGRMDMHIELSYCCFEAFKMLAKNYLSLESHHSFDTIRCLLEETNITPADVAENLMPKVANEDVETSLERLIRALRSSKEKAHVKAEKEKGTTAMEEPNGKESSEEEAADAS
ncbi:AAA-ATPase At3g28580-like [Gastrolobium bilobum]|uniref:AAA-ATPase At3g28580-like n=1 Tax=Gastrolobium bilobum TaxID=150636 RepID=UPI002AAFA9A8|nr:AAA-ATPase At3g28580-like [Gastrolobium bilobum]